MSIVPLNAVVPVLVHTITVEPTALVTEVSVMTPPVFVKPVIETEGAGEPATSSEFVRVNV